MQVIGTVLSVFLLLFLGYIAKKVRILRAEDAGLLSTVVVYFTLPAYVFEAIYSCRQPLPLSMVKVPVVGLGAILVVAGVAYIAGRVMRLDRRIIGGLMIASAFGNTGFLGYPVVQAVFQEKAALVTAALYDEVAMAMPLYTLGAFIAAAFADEKLDTGQIKKALTIPALWAIPLALLLRFLSLPEPLLDAISLMAGGTVPLAMMAMGLSLSASSLKGLAGPVMVACVLKLGLLPLITHWATSAAGVTGLYQQITVLESGMPTAVMSGVVASKFGHSGRFVAGVIFVSTLIGIVTIPLILLVQNIY